MTGVRVSFRFYEELNEFLAPQRRKVQFEYRCARAATVKNAVESIGVPHTEVELILVNGVSVDFAYRVRDGDQISVYPVFEAFDVTPVVRVRERPLRDTRFLADAHLGGLAKLLRMLGYDTVCLQHESDREIVARSVAEHRIVLTRDRELLKCRDVTHGCFVHALAPLAQLRELISRLHLTSIAPFSRCLQCNEPLQPVDKATIAEEIPPRAAQHYESFTRCAVCTRVYWQGSHWERMRGMLAGLDLDRVMEPSVL